MIFCRIRPFPITVLIVDLAPLASIILEQTFWSRILNIIVFRIIIQCLNVIGYITIENMY